MARYSVKVQEILNHAGKLPAHSSVGGYPIFYLNKRGETFCAKCANDPELDETITDGDIHWEGDPITCDSCQENIEPAYPDDEDEDDDDEEDTEEE